MSQKMSTGFVYLVQSRTSLLKSTKGITWLWRVYLVRISKAYYFKTPVFNDTVTSYIGTERILSYVGVSQNEDIFVKGYNCVFSWRWNFTKSKTFRRLKFNYNWILALSQSYADSHNKFCNSNSLWNNGVSIICSSFEIYAKKSQEYSR